jgi:hypothetical protein
MRICVEKAIAAMEAAEQLSFELQDLLEIRERLQIAEANIIRAPMRTDRAKRRAQMQR